MKLFRFFLMAFALVGLTPLNAMFTAIDSDEDSEIMDSPSFEDQEVDGLLSRLASIQMQENNSPTTQLLPSESSTLLEDADDKWLYDTLLGEEEDLLSVGQESPISMRESRKAVFVATAEDAPSTPYSPHRTDLVRHGKYLAKLDGLINQDTSSETTYEAVVKAIQQTALLEQFEDIQNTLLNAQKNVCFANAQEVFIPEEIATLLLIELSKITEFLHKIVEKKSISRDEYIAIVNQGGKFIETTIKLIDSVNVSQARVNTLQTMPKNRLKTSKKAYICYYSPLVERAIEGISILLNEIIPSLHVISYFGTVYEKDIQKIADSHAALFDIEYVFLPTKYFKLCQKVQDLKEWISQDFAYDKIRDLATLVTDITSMIAEADELAEIPSVVFSRPYAALVDELNGICQIAQPVFEHIEQQGSDIIDAKMRLEIAQIIRSVMSLYIPAQFEYKNYELSDSVRELLQEPSISARSVKKLQYSASYNRLHLSPSRLSISPSSTMWHIDSQDCHYPRGQTPVVSPEWVEYNSSDAMSLVEDRFTFMMTDPADTRIGQEEGKVLLQQLKQVYGRVAELSHRQNSFALTSHAQWVAKWLLQYCQSVLGSFIDVDITECVEAFNIDPTSLNEMIESVSSVHRQELLGSSQNEYADFVQTSSSLYKILQQLLKDLQSIHINEKYISKRFGELNERQKSQILLQVKNVLQATTLATSSTIGVVYYLQDKFDLQEFQSQQTQAQLITIFLLGQIFKVVNFTHLIVADLAGNDQMPLVGVMKLLQDAHSYGEFHAEWAHQALHNIRPASAAM